MLDVIIIGAGLSGLTTAYKIVQKEPSLKIKILEAETAIGGQIASTPHGEVGGKWILADQYHIYNLLTELRVPMRRRAPISKSLKRCWALDDGVFACVAKFELQRYMDDLDLKSQLFRPGTYRLTREDRDYTMWHHIKGKMCFRSSRTFMMNFVQLVTGTDPKDICYVEFMNLVHSCGGLKILTQLYLEPSPSLLEFSSEQLLGAFETRLEGVTVERMARVMEIQHHRDLVTVREANGTVHSARVAVLAIPWNQIVDIFITPPVPASWELSVPSNKCYITSFIIDYDEAHWRRRGFSGNFYCEDPVIFAQQYKTTSISGIVLHDAGFELLARSIILKTLGQYFCHEMTDPLEYTQQTFEQSSLLNLPQTFPWNRVIWSSASSATLYRGCLSGAVQSGLRAAVHALLILRPQNVTWQDLAEVQKANAVYRYPGVFDLIKSSINVYNTVFYTLVGLIGLYVVRHRNRILSF